ncbi:helix-turn-helix domain-containing protein [Coraliomargarita algicola]|uniref:Helix-turn-helix domain-containing protein n=1 Tax=Coraliomargarita algicola TaxID=3092156 RepID=A0ABZ0RRA4_9BACT|nr:helix-turn-helix domain-containing protein [Coraliomargarita sp. J2-16]WPJ97641.1 helix-turn-helix domain-containing protein [Coraliomargarita sp. J2-16]
MKTDILLTKKQASERLGVSERTIDRMIVNGELQRVRVRGCVRIRKSEIVQLIGGVEA